MSKKDYEVIARTIQTNMRRGFGDVYETATRDIALMLAREFETTNPRFNRATFLRACGVEVSS